MKDIGATWGIQSDKASFEDSAGRGANMLLSGGTDMLGDDNALRDSRSAGPMSVGGRSLLCGGMCVRRGCARVCSVTTDGLW